MELFDKKFVHFMWDDELEGKKCFVGNSVDFLMSAVEHNDKARMPYVTKSSYTPPFAMVGFEDTEDGAFTFAYYDPNYDVKWAYYKEGKKVQTRYPRELNEWDDVDTPLWRDNIEYRIKPEVAWCVCEMIGRGLQIMELDDVIESTVLFKGTSEECYKWVEGHEKKCPCEEGIDSKACAGCEHSEDGKPHPFENYHCYGCDKPNRKYRPYESPAEMIMDFIDRFKVNCPSYCEPLIWVKGKGTDNRYLVFAFCENGIEFNDDEPLGFEPLFDCYTYLDGSPVGMEVKEC